MYNPRKKIKIYEIGAPDKGLPALGYKRTIIIDKQRSEMIRDIYQSRVDGIAGVQLSEYIRDKYDERLAKSTLHKILTNKFYIGVYTYNKKDYPHHYGKIIDEELFNEVQKTLAESKYKNFHTRPLTFGYNANNTINVHQSDIVRLIFNTYADSDMLSEEISDYLKKEHDLTLTPNFIRKALRSKIYIGWHNASFYNNLVIIEEELFDRVEKKRNKLNKRLDKSIYASFIKCGCCGKNLVSGYKSTNGSVTFVCFFNPTHSKELKAKTTDDKVSLLIHKIMKRLPPEYQKLSFKDIFKSVICTGIELSYEMNEPYNSMTLKVPQDPLLMYLHIPRSLEDIINHLSLSLSEVQQQLTDLEIKGEIQEQSGYWKAI